MMIATEQLAQRITTFGQLQQEQGAMAFVFEEILKGERYLISHLKAKFSEVASAADDPRVRHWTIDRNRNAILVFLGGGGPQMPQFHSFIWKNESIELSGTEEIKYPKQEGEQTQVFRTIFPYAIPDSLFSQQGELLDLIREAFVATGYAGRTEETIVHVEFSNHNKGEN